MKLDYPATGRNRDYIARVLRDVLPERGTVLEVASGSGQHATYFAGQFPELMFQPSDPEAQARASIDAWREHLGHGNVRPALAIDATEPTSWPAFEVDAVLNINMIHISPWAACVGLLEGAAARLPNGAPLYFYGPFVVDGVDTAASNVRFDQSLRSRNPSWGVRGLAEVTRAAEAVGFALERTVEMPANNLSVIFRRG